MSGNILDPQGNGRCWWCRTFTAEHGPSWWILRLHMWYLNRHPDKA